jgi:hypothetical protein
MLFIRGTLAVVAISSILGGVARGATVLTTAPLELQGSNVFVCLVTNVGATKNVQLSLEIFDPNGVSLFSTAPLTLAPLHEVSIGRSAAVAPRICQITMVQGSKQSIRASACIEDSGGTCIANTEAR